MIKGFSLDIYDSDIAFAFNTNKDELSKFLETAGVPEDKRDTFFEHVFDEAAGAITVKYGCGTNTITIFNVEPNNKVVAHELYHVTYQILTPRGIEDEEAWAYLIGYLTEMFYDLYLNDEDQNE